MCDAKNLLAAAERLELVADGFCGTASDAYIDFVEDERARSGDFSVGFGGMLFDGDFEREDDPAHFAAGGDFMQRLERLAGVGGDAVFDFVPAVGRPLRIVL